MFNFPKWINKDILYSYLRKIYPESKQKVAMNINVEMCPTDYIRGLFVYLFDPWPRCYLLICETVVYLNRKGLKTDHGSHCPNLCEVREADRSEEG